MRVCVPYAYVRQVRAWAWACSFPLSCTIARMNGYSMSDSAFCILDTGKRSLGWDGMIGCFFRCRCLYTVWRFRCAHACYGIGVGVNHTSFIPPHTYSSSNYPNSDICFAARLDLELISIHPHRAYPGFALPCLALPCLATHVHPPVFLAAGRDLCFAYHTSHRFLFNDIRAV